MPGLDADVISDATPAGTAEAGGGSHDPRPGSVPLSTVHSAEGDAPPHSTAASHRLRVRP